ncbi:MAG: flagellar protein FlaG [Desulfobacterales bacterium]|nr:flagellar protein FlaG [Desulfobacterales bacterium]
MEVSSKIRPVNPYDQKIVSTVVASISPEKPYLPINSDQQRIEQFSQVKADTTQKIADGIKNFLTSRDVRLEFSIDKNAGEITVRIIQNQTDRIIREISGGMILGGIGTIDETV